MPFERRWLRPAEAAERLGCSVKTIYNKIALEKIPFSRALGSHAPRIDWRKIEESLEKGAKG